jgi:hypothetical protein
LPPFNTGSTTEIDLLLIAPLRPVKAVVFPRAHSAGLMEVFTFAALLRAEQAKGLLHRFCICELVRYPLGSRGCAVADRHCWRIWANTTAMAE